MYKTTKQFGTGREMPDKNFSSLQDAMQYTQQAAETDADMKIQCVYRIYEFDEVMHEVDSSKLKVDSKSGSAGSSGKGKGSSFSPTPFATSAKPKGAVQHWKKDADDDEEK